MPDEVADALDADAVEGRDAVHVSETAVEHGNGHALSL